MKIMVDSTSDRTYIHINKRKYFTLAHLDPKALINTLKLFAAYKNLKIIDSGNEFIELEGCKEREVLFAIKLISTYKDCEEK